ncbi:2934_t:CDS:2, partial [Scutellospora calospora]
MHEKVIVGRVYRLFDRKNEDKAIERFIEEIEKHDIFKGDNLESILNALNNENHLIKFSVNVAPSYLYVWSKSTKFYLAWPYSWTAD